MKECKSGWVEPLSEETAQGIIEALRKLEEASELDEAVNRLAEHIFEDMLKDIGLNEDIMKEKKTKKMTKVEAFEWLKGKKVMVCGREMNDKVQSKLFACGVEWKFHGTDVCYYSDYLVINSEGFLCHCDGMDEDYWNRLFHEEISVDEILSIEIVDEKKDDERKGEILEEIAKLGEKISDLIEEYEGDIIIEINQYEVLLRNSGDILYRK